MKTIIERGASWTLDETKMLLALWGQDFIQRQASNTKRTKETYEKISEKFNQCGFERTAEQVRTRVFNMIAEYRRILKDPTPERMKKCIFFENLHKIYQARHMNDQKSPLDDYDDYTCSPVSNTMSSEIGDESNISDSEANDGNEMINSNNNSSFNKQNNNNSGGATNSSSSNNDNNNTANNTINNNNSSSNNNNTNPVDPTSDNNGDSSTISNDEKETNSSNSHLAPGPPSTKKVKLESPPLTATQAYLTFHGLPEPTTSSSSSSSTTSNINNSASKQSTTAATPEQQHSSKQSKSSTPPVATTSPATGSGAGSSSLASTSTLSSTPTSSNNNNINNITITSAPSTSAATIHRHQSLLMPPTAGSNSTTLSSATSTPINKIATSGANNNIYMNINSTKLPIIRTNQLIGNGTENVNGKTPRLPTTAATISHQLYQAPVNTFDVTSSALLIDRMFSHLSRESENMREWIALEKERLALERLRRQQETEREVRRERVLIDTLMRFQEQWLSFVCRLDPRIVEGANDRPPELRLPPRDTASNQSTEQLSQNTQSTIQSSASQSSTSTATTSTTSNTSTSTATSK